LDDTEQDDRRLAKQLKAGSEKAWHEFSELYAEPLYRYVYSLARHDASAATELAQETIVTAVQHIRRFDDRKGTLWAWLCGIAVNKSREAARAWVREARAIESVAAMVSVENGPADPSPDEDASRILVSLHPHHQEVLRLKYMQGHSVADIAKSLSLTEKAVESRLSRARDAYRKAYSGTAPGEHADE
jgi:RNA polymerase sigma factor (sigma-70 family)